MRIWRLQQRFQKLPFSHLLELTRAAAFLFCFLCIRFHSPSCFFFPPPLHTTNSSPVIPLPDIKLASPTPLNYEKGSFTLAHNTRFHNGIDSQGNQARTHMPKQQKGVFSKKGAQAPAKRSGTPYGAELRNTSKRRKGRKKSR